MVFIRVVIPPLNWRGTIRSEKKLTNIYSGLRSEIITPSLHSICWRSMSGIRLRWTEQLRDILGSLPSREAFWEYCRQHLKDLAFLTDLHHYRFTVAKYISEWRQYTTTHIHLVLERWFQHSLSPSRTFTESKNSNTIIRQHHSCFAFCSKLLLQLVLPKELYAFGTLVFPRSLPRSHCHPTISAHHHISLQQRGSRRAIFDVRVFD
jgi:hypothetical protein